MADELGPRAGYVLAGEGWHPGVIGIVASRLVERHHRPVGRDLARRRARRARLRPQHRRLRPSARGLEDAAPEHLGRFGGHRAAAGVELERAQLDAFAAAFAAHAGEAIGEAEPRAVEHVDAIVECGQLGLSLAEELGRLAPFGRANPPVCLMIEEAQMRDPRPMGEGRHLRFTVEVAAALSAAPAACASTEGAARRCRSPINQLEPARVEPRVVRARGQRMERRRRAAAAVAPRGRPRPAPPSRSPRASWIRRAHVASTAACPGAVRRGARQETVDRQLALL